LTQLNSTQLNSTQRNAIQLNSTQLNPARLSFTCIGRTEYLLCSMSGSASWSSFCYKETNDGHFVNNRNKREHEQSTTQSVLLLSTLRRRFGWNTGGSWQNNIHTRMNTRTRTRTQKHSATTSTLLLLLFVCGGWIGPQPCRSWKISSPVSSSPSSFRRRNRNRDGRRFRCCRGGGRDPTTRLGHSSARVGSDADATAGVVNPDSFFPAATTTHRPLLAIITETDACDSEENTKRTLGAIRQAVSTGKVDLVSVRLSLPNDDDDNEHHRREVLDRARVLTEKLVKLSSEQRQEQSNGSCSSTSFRVVCSSDLVSVAVRARAHGVHVKEHHLHRLPDIVDRFDYPIVVGTSTHSVESALDSYFGDGNDNDNDGGVRIPKPHYYFVGTCYLTASHPEKTRQDQLEGPELPGKVKRALSEKLESQQREEEGCSKTSSSSSSLPRILAIGGIDETNCHDPVAMGADGVAVIRAVLQADRPLEMVEEMQGSMARAGSSI